MSEPSLGVPETAHVDVFISYRRNEASYLAGWLHDTLTARLGRDRVFLDIDAIRPGVDFMQTISTAVPEPGSCWSSSARDGFATPPDA